MNSDEISRISKSINIDSKMVVTLGYEGGGQVGGNWGLTANEYGGSGWDGMKNSLKLMYITL